MNIRTKLDIATDSPADGCPIGSYGCGDAICPNTCFCEDHCSWKKCKIRNPPLSCIENGNRKWDHDYHSNFWRASLDGIFISLLLNLSKVCY